MGSKGRLPPPHHLRQPLPGPGMGYRDPLPPEMHSHRGGFPPYNMPSHPEIMEQKLAAQHAEMQKLATENKRLAATHGTLRQELAGIQHELQMLHNHVAAVKSEREQQIMGLLDKIKKMEAELQGAEPLKMELHKARADAQSLFAAREELVSRVQQLTVDHQRVHMELQQVPALMSELESLRQEFQHSRATFEYEKKVCNEHLESLQVMEKNYINMANEVEKLRAELKKHAETEKKTAADGNTAAGGVQPGPAGLRAGYDVYRPPGPAVPGYAPAYDPQWGPGAPAYDPQWGHVAPPVYVPQRGPTPPGYDAHRGPAGPGYGSYGGPGGTGYDRQRGPVVPARGPQYGGSQGQGMQQGNTGGVVVTGHGGGGVQGAPVQPPPAPPADGSHAGRR